MIEEKYYREYDYLKNTIYLDTASVAMQPQRTLDYCRTFQDEFVEYRGRKCFDGTYGMQRNHTIELISKMLHCASSDIMFTQNTTEGNNLLVNCLPLSWGDSVITTDIEFPSLILGWAQKQTEGIDLKLVNTKNGAFEAEDVIELMDETTRVVSLSLVHNLTGFMPDIAKIGSACRRRGIILAVDAIQCLGRTPVDVEAMCIDYLSCGAFKGLLGVFGTGFIYCSPALQARMQPRVYGDENIQFIEGSTAGKQSLPVYPYEPGLEAFSTGSQSTYGISTLGISLEMLLDIGIEKIRERIVRLEGVYRQRLQELMPDIVFLGKNEAVYWSGNISFYFDREKTKELEQTLEEKHMIAYVDEGYLRISLHYFNTEAQMKLTAETVASVLSAV